MNGFITIATSMGRRNPRRKKLRDEAKKLSRKAYFCSTGMASCEDRPFNSQEKS